MMIDSAPMVLRVRWVRSAQFTPIVVSGDGAASGAR